MVARARDGSTRAFPVVETVHQNSILLVTEAPAHVPASVLQQAQRVAEKAVACLDGELPSRWHMGHLACRLSCSPQALQSVEVSQDQASLFGCIACCSIRSDEGPGKQACSPALQPPSLQTSLLQGLGSLVQKCHCAGTSTHPPTEAAPRPHIVSAVQSWAAPQAVLRGSAMVVRRLASVCAGAGVFGVEMFLLEDGQILLNEVAPRPHNSGHYTIEGCATSQFEQHLRAVMGWPLGSPDLATGSWSVPCLASCYSARMLTTCAEHSQYGPSSTATCCCWAASGLADLALRLLTKCWAKLGSCKDVSLPAASC